MAIFNTNKETSTPTKGQNILGHGTVIKGDISCEGPIRIDGKLEGTVTSKGKIIIGKTAEINGDLNAKNIDIEGAFNGKVFSENAIHIKSTATVIGEVNSKSLSIEEGAVFNAMSKTNKEEVKSLNPLRTKKAKAN